MKHRLCRYSLVLIAIAALILLSACGAVHPTPDHGGVILWRGVEQPLSADDTAALCDLFDGSELFFDNPSCGFDDQVIAVRIGEYTFVPAQDGCAAVRCGLRYFSLSEPERDAMRSVLRSYGASFPCY